MQSTPLAGEVSGNAPRVPLARRVEQYAEWAFDLLARRHTTPNAADRADILSAASTQATIADALGKRDLADSNRELARAHTQLALSYDALVDELRAKRGLRDAA